MVRDDEIGKKEGNVYTQEGREELLENDEISATEERFMEGAEGGGQDAKCALCGAVLGDMESTYERDFDGDIYYFCSEEHAMKYAGEHKKKK